MPIGSADQEGHVGRAAVKVAAQLLGEGFAGQRLAAFVLFFGEAFRWKCTSDDVAFLAHARSGGGGLRFIELGDGDFRDAAFAAKPLGARQIILGKKFLGAGLQTPGRDDL